MFKKFSAGRN